MAIKQKLASIFKAEQAFNLKTNQRCGIDAEDLSQQFLATGAASFSLLLHKLISLYFNTIKYCGLHLD